MSVASTKLHVSNALKCYWSYALSRIGLVRISHMPLFVSVEPAAICQLRCPECPVAFGNKVAKVHTMSMEIWERVIEEVRGTAWVMQFYFQGEPLLNKDLPQMIREAHEAGLYTIVSTNAQALTREMAEALVSSGLNRIIVSMDGLTDESYNAYRIGGSLDKCKAALQYLREAKSVCQRSGLIIELQCLRLKTNEHEWSELKREYKSLGADTLTLKTAQLYDYAHGHPLMPSEPKYSRYVRGKDGLYHRRKLGKGCWRAWSVRMRTETSWIRLSRSCTRMRRQLLSAARRWMNNLKYARNAGGDEFVKKTYKTPLTSNSAYSAPSSAHHRAAY